MKKSWDQEVGDLFRMMDRIHRRNIFLTAMFREFTAGLKRRIRQRELERRTPNGNEIRKT